MMILAIWGLQNMGIKLIMQIYINITNNILIDIILSVRFPTKSKYVEEYILNLLERVRIFNNSVLL